MNKYLKLIPEMSVRGCKTPEEFDSAVLAAKDLLRNDVKDTNVRYVRIGTFYAKITRSGNIIVWKVN